MKPEHLLEITLNLNEPQREVLSRAVKGSDINPFTRNGTVVVNKNTVLPVREMVVNHWKSKFAIKTKTTENLETCFLCERVIDKIDNILYNFGYEAPEEQQNENEPAIISIPSLTATEKPMVEQEPQLHEVRAEIVETITVRAEVEEPKEEVKPKRKPKETDNG